MFMFYCVLAVRRMRGTMYVRREARDDNTNNALLAAKVMHEI